MARDTIMRASEFLKAPVRLVGLYPVGTKKDLHESVVAVQIGSRMFVFERVKESK